MNRTLLPTSLVGSYAQPNWLIDRKSLAERFPPRLRAQELWRVSPELLDKAQDDATLLAICDRERAGLDIITDGEQRRESIQTDSPNSGPRRDDSDAEPIRDIVRVKIAATERNLSP